MDTIGDLLIRIKNGYLTHKKSVVCSVSKIKLAILKILKDNGYIAGYKIKEEKIIEIDLKYENKEAALTDIKRVSKPSLRVYAGWKGLPRVLSGIGLCIVSTSKGLMTGKEARSQKLGGEIICKVW